MHPYATDSRERLLVPFWIAAVSIGLAYALHLTVIMSHLDLWWVDIPSVLGFYLILYGLFERWAWRIRMFRWLRIVRVPDLQGEWKGSLTSSHTDEAGSRTEQGASVRIVQTWTQMSVAFSSEQSTSRSQIAGILLACGPPN